MSGHAYRHALAVLCSGHVYRPPARSLEAKPKKVVRNHISKHGKRENALTSRRVAEAARMCSSNNAAAEMLGCQPGSFARFCCKNGIETPNEARRRKRSLAICQKEN